MVVGYVILVIVVVVLLVLGAVMVRRRGPKRGLTYAPSPTALQEKLMNLTEVPVVPIFSPEATTEQIAGREFKGDTTDDLLDPHNPHHAEWVHQHPLEESDEEYLIDHPEDTPHS
jgi:hypothetical protein